jgi:GLPGLI family protein
MKKLTLIVIILLLQKVNAQDYSLLITYKMETRFSSIETYHSFLKVGKGYAQFEYTSNSKGEDEWNSDSTILKLKSKDSSSYLINTDLEKDIIKEMVPKIGKKDLFVLHEKIPEIIWAFKDSTRLIGKFRCKLASTSFRGRNYTAWYCEEIPISFGPFKFHGLPGAILEITDEKKEVAFYANKVEQFDGKFISFPQNYKQMDRIEYRQMIINKVNAILKNVVAKSGRDSDMTAQLGPIKAIELF